MRSVVAFSFLLFAAPLCGAETWTPLGPPGGDARVLAVDPSDPACVFLGTADGHVFGSRDSGARWKLLGAVSPRHDAVITAILVDPRGGANLLASYWERDALAGGGVARSEDGGLTWTPAGLDGQSVRALARAPSAPDSIVAGTLDGIYRSTDNGRTWQRISPEHHEELRNLDSLAVDPRDPNTIYAGTFHLPWKTSDGGASWRPAHDGMIDDSDVMSLLIDRADPRSVYASACSGIYRSDDAGGVWRKIQGIPYTARRTYAIAQDPRMPERVYAATSEGLWKTEDAGATWRRTTPDSWVVNSVVVGEGAPGRVLIGTEERGVLESDDGGEHFADANRGFEHRQVVGMAVDPRRPERILAVLAHAPDPVLLTPDGGQTWAPLGSGLRGERVRRVFAGPPDGAWWASLDRGGLLRYDPSKDAWNPTPAPPVASPDAHAAVSGSPARRKGGRGGLGNGGQQAVVLDLAFGSKEWYAATNSGLFVSADGGSTWTHKSVAAMTSLPVNSVRVSADGAQIWVSSMRGLIFSADHGATWAWHDLPPGSGGAIRLEREAGVLVASSPIGLYISRDAGQKWQHAANGLPSTPVQDFVVSGNWLVAAMQTGGIYASEDGGRAWNRLPGTVADGSFETVTLAGAPGAILAASTTEGIYRVERLASGAQGVVLPEGAPSAEPAAR